MLGKVIPPGGNLSFFWAGRLTLRYHCDLATVPNLLQIRILWYSCATQTKSLSTLLHWRPNEFGCPTNIHYIHEWLIWASLKPPWSWWESSYGERFEMRNHCFLGQSWFELSIDYWKMCNYCNYFWWPDLNCFLRYCFKKFANCTYLWCFKNESCLLQQHVWMGGLHDWL